MLHLRLRRLIRLAVSFLSLNFAGYTLGSRSTPLVLRGVSTVIDPADFPSLDLHQAPRSIFIPGRPVTWASSKRMCRLPGHKYLPAFGLLIAFLLELSSCNVIRDIGQTPGPPGSTPSVREAVRPEQNVLFYDPPESATATAKAQLTLTGHQLEPRPAALEARPLPWAIPESVFFVYRGRDPARRATERLSELRPYRSPIATAFVISVPDRAHNRFVRFLVTARHVVDPQWAHCSDRNPVSIEVRLNRRSGGVGYEAVPLQSASRLRFYTPSDSTADLAVIPLDHALIPHLDDYKFLDVPFRLLPTESEIRLLRPDQPIMTAGLSPRPYAEFGNYPVFDAGFLSKMPSEAVGAQCGVAQNPEAPAMPLHLWFISAGLPQGTSGAPVYTSVVRGAGARKTTVLLGIQSVAWPDRGVAGITPSTVLADLIRSSLRQSKLNLDFYRGPDPSP